MQISEDPDRVMHFVPALSVFLNYLECRNQQKELFSCCPIVLRLGESMFMLNTYT